jgi:transcriptional regulator with XRE-family HTH domain
MNLCLETGCILSPVGNPSADWIMPQKKTEKAEPFGKRLTRLRQVKGFTQGELAERIGVSQRVLCYYERETEYPPTHLLPKMAEALGLSLDELMNAAPPKPEAIPKNSRLQRKLRVVETLSKPDQKAIVRMIDALALKHAKAT